jgi:hypothetical protein
MKKQPPPKTKVPSEKFEIFCKDMVESIEELIAGLKNENIYNSDRLSNILFLLCSVTGVPFK